LCSASRAWLFSLLLLGAHLVGAIPSGVILTRIAGGDPPAGSGNIGATNVYRVAGRRLGITLPATPWR
jgi:glycerol-3-phosphate acyltransferase PlsY